MRRIAPAKYNRKSPVPVDMRTRLALLQLESRLTPSGSVPVGPEFQVNTHTTGLQSLPAMAMDADGNFVVTWASDGQDGDEFGIYAQRFNSLGVPQGSEFPVNTFTTERQHRPVVAMDMDGDFVVAWIGYGNQDGDGSGVFAQRFNAAGIPQGAEFQVNSFTAHNQTEPAVAMDAAGKFVVTWMSSNEDVNDWDVFGRLYNAAGVPQSDEFQVNTFFTLSSQYHPTVTMSALGNFVVAWQSLNQGVGDDQALYARRFNSAGVPLGHEFHVNTFVTNRQYEPAIAIDSTGAFVICWTSDGQESMQNPNNPWDSAGIYAQRYNALGLPQGGEFHVNTYTSNAQRMSKVAVDADGNFVITWESLGQDGSSYGVYAQKYDAAGMPQGGEFRVNTTTNDWQGSPTIAMDPAGDFVVAWTGGGGQDGDGWGTFAQRFTTESPLPGTINVSDVQIIEGNTVTKSASVTVRLSTPSLNTISIQYATAAGTAAAGKDFQSSSGTITFDPGETTKTVNVSIIGDRLSESDETFFVNLSNPVNATVGDAQGLCTIVDDEPRFLIDDVSDFEGANKTNKSFVFSVSLSNAYDQSVTVSYKTQGGTATSGKDFVAQSGTLTFLPGETQKSITILVIGDNKPDPYEYFSVLLFGASSNAFVLDGTGYGLIWHDD